MQTTNRVFWKNMHMRFESEEIRGLFRPLMMGDARRLEIGGTVWVTTFPGKGSSIIGFARATVNAIIRDTTAAKIVYKSHYETGDVYIFEKNIDPPKLYMLVKSEGDLERLAGSSPHATIPMTGY